MRSAPRKRRCLDWVFPALYVREVCFLNIGYEHLARMRTFCSGAYLRQLLLCQLIKITLAAVAVAVVGQLNALLFTDHDAIHLDVMPVSQMPAIPFSEYKALLCHRLFSLPQSNPSQV